MAITHTTTVRNALANLIDDQVNSGTTDANGDLVIMTSGDVEVATLALSNPAFGAASSGTITAASITDDTSATGGTAALFKFQNRDNTEVFRGSVGTSGATNLPMQVGTLAAGKGALLVDVNPNSNPFSEMAQRTGGFFCQGPSGEILPEMAEALR